MNNKSLKLKRYDQNPIMLPKGDSWEVMNVSNAAAATAVWQWGRWKWKMCTSGVRKNSFYI